MNKALERYSSKLNSLYRHESLSRLAILVFAFLLSLGRLFISNQNSLRNTLWAEDGLFPECWIAFNNVNTCVFKSYAGYLNFLPKVLTWVTAQFELPSWPLVANLISASFAAVCCFLVWNSVSHTDFKNYTKIFMSLAPIMTPILGYEVVNSIASSYILLLYVAAIQLTFGGQKAFQTITTSSIIFMTGLTTPSAIALIPLIFALASQKLISKKSTIIYFSVATLSLGVQAFVIITSEVRRNTSPEVSNIFSWLSNLPRGISGVFIPWEIDGYKFWEYSMAFLVALALTLILINAHRLKRSNHQIFQKAIFLFAFGLLVSFVPAATGPLNHRYFITLDLVLTAIFAMTIDVFGRIVNKNWWITGTTLLVCSWVMSFPANSWRATPYPSWAEQIETIQKICKESNAPYNLVFTPGFVDRSINIRCN